MIRRTLLRSAIFLALASGALLAADVTGKWTAEMKGPDGDSRSMTFDFKQDGSTLSGTVEGPGGEALQIKDGKVEGDKISFTLNLAGGDGDMKITHEGTIKGDEITLTMKMEGGPGPGGPGGGRGPGGPDGGPPPMKLKRAK